MGARAVLNAAKSRTDSLSRWAVALEQRRGYWRAVVAIAAKNARMAWAVLRRGEAFAMLADPERLRRPAAITRVQTRPIPIPIPIPLSRKERPTPDPPTAA